MQLVNFEKIIGSFGIGKFCSFAWSLKLRPIPKNFDGFETHEPILSALSIIGSSSRFNFSIFC